MSANYFDKVTGRHLKAMAALLAFCGIGYTACAITIDSSQLSIWGGWSEYWTAGGQNYHTSDTFSSTRTDGQPVSTSVQSSPHAWNSASSTLGAFNLSMSADSVAWNPAGSGTSIGINALGTTLFHVGSTRLAFTLNALSYWNYFMTEQDMQVTLRDVTASVTLLSVDHLDEPMGQPVNLGYNFDVDPSHQYEFTISGWINAFDAKEANMSLQVELGDGVPDLGMTLLLLAGSLSALIWARQVTDH